MADYNKKYYIRYKSTTSATPNITAWSDWTPPNSKVCSSKVSSLSGSISPQLKYGFDPEWQGDPLPSNAIIRGIKVYFSRASGEPTSTNFVVDNLVKIDLMAGGLSSNKADTSTKWPWYVGTGAFQQKIYGGESDTWGFDSEDLTGDVFNESFELVVSLAMTCNRTGYDAYTQGEPYPSSAYTSWVVIYYDIPILPTVTTTTPYNIDFEDAWSGGENITSQDSSNLTAGLQWRTYPGGAIHTRSRTDVRPPSFSMQMTGLDPGIEYEVRAFVTDSAGTVYGSWIRFTTLTDRPEVSTITPFDIQSLTAWSGVHIIDANGTLTQKGIIWHYYPTIPNLDNYLGDERIGGSSTADQTFRMTGLHPNTDYYVRAFAVNEHGTGYASPIKFTTTANVPTLSTRDPDLYPFEITSTSAQSGGYNITANGNILEVGVCWNTSGNPNINDDAHTGISTTSAANFIIDNTLFTGLMAGTFYFVRAYAINESGPGYGGEETFWTLAGTAPTVATRCPPLSKSHNSAYLGGTINLNGNTFVQQGIDYTELSSGNGGRVTTSDFIADFNLWVTGLTPSTNYSFFAYVETVEFGETRDNPPFLCYFTTDAMAYPTVHTYDPNAEVDPFKITNNYARSGGYSINMNGQTLISKNLNYRKLSGGGGPIIRITDPNVNTDNYHLEMTSLESSTTYECYAYLETGIGSFFGEHLEFTTLALPTGIVKKWNGSIWTLVTPKKWNGASWQDAVTKWWTGSAWSDHH